MTSSDCTQNRTSQTGDALWVARSKVDPRVSYALDYVVERKTVKDLVGSIKNGRYERQKYVLQRCGLRRVMYLIEGNPDVEVQGVRHQFQTMSNSIEVHNQGQPRKGEDGHTFTLSPGQPLMQCSTLTIVRQT